MKLLKIAVLFLASMYVQAQDDLVRNCYLPIQKNPVNKSNILNNNAQFRQSATTGIIKIPVVIHVIHNQQNEAIGVGNNISKAQIESQIRVLNEDFRKKINTKGFNSNPVGADTEIEFHLSNVDTNCMPFDGITRSYNAKGRFDLDTDEILIKSINYYPTNQFLNIWVCSLTALYLGGAAFPEQSGLEGLDDETFSEKKDGVIIHTKAFGSQIGTAATGNYSYGRTTTHEIGHWLGLKHIWGDANCGDDYCNDTPTVLDKNTGNCNNIISNCKTTPVTTMTENYLDYSYDICMNIFTENQKNRMRTALENSPRRVALLTSPGQNQLIIQQIPYTQQFQNITNLNEIGWEQNLSTNNFNWNIGNENIFINCSNITTPGLAKIITTPFFKIPNVNDIHPIVTVTFKLKYPNLLLTDSLTVSIYNGCKKNKTYLKSFFGTSLASADTFKVHTMTISGMKNVAHLKLQFEVFSKGKATMYLDDFTVKYPPSITTIDIIQKTQTNPLIAAFDSKKMEIYAFLNNNDTTDILFEIYDILGQKLLTSNQKFDSSNKYTIKINNFSTGIHLLVAKNFKNIHRTKILLVNE